MSPLAAAADAVVLLGLVVVLSTREVLAAGALAPRFRQALDVAAVPLLVAFCLLVGRQVAAFF